MADSGGKISHKKVLTVVMAGGLFVFLLLLSVFAIFSVSSGKLFNPFKRINAADGRINNYVVAGKIKDIKGDTILLETLTADFFNNPSAQKKTEIRKLEVKKETSVVRLNFIPIKEGVIIPDNPKAGDFLSASKFRGEIASANFGDLKTGSNVSVDYSPNKSWIKDEKFVISQITILPYSAY